MTLLAFANAQTPSQKTTLVELFTSQSCNSCVAANDVFRDLLQDDGIVGLAWHVDYWNTLQTENGRWNDPFSSEFNTTRQRKYNLNIRGRASVYTPQIIIDGADEVVGSSMENISAKVSHSNSRHGISLKLNNSTNGIEIDIGTSDDGGNAYIVEFIPFVSTEILHGENAGRTFTERNIVVNVKKLGVVRRKGQKFYTQRPLENLGCAVLVQEPSQGIVLAAQYCP